MVPAREARKIAKDGRVGVRTLARRTLPFAVFDFADGGAEDERTLRRNETAFDEIELLLKLCARAACS